MADKKNFSRSDKIWVRLGNILFLLWTLQLFFSGHLFMALICAVLFLMSCYGGFKISESEKESGKKQRVSLAVKIKTARELFGRRR